MKNRLCCKNCKYIKVITIDGVTSNYCKMPIEVFNIDRIYTIKDIDYCKCEMFKDVEGNILGVIKNEN